MIKGNLFDANLETLFEELLTEDSFWSKEFLNKLSRPDPKNLFFDSNKIAIGIDGELIQTYPLIEGKYDIISLPVLDTFNSSDNFRKEMVDKISSIELEGSRFVFDSKKNREQFSRLLVNVIRYLADALVVSLGNNPDYFDYLFARNSMISIMGMLGFKVNMLQSEFYTLIPVEVVFGQFIPKDMMSKIVSVKENKLSGLAKADFQTSLLVLERYLPGSIERFGDFDDWNWRSFNLSN